MVDVEWAAQARRKDELILAASKEDPAWVEHLWAGCLIPESKYGCWEWQRHRNPKGYGVTYLPTSFVRGRKGKAIAVSAHRAAWVVASGRVVEYGMTLDHIVCDNESCCRPDHLMEQTRELNTRRGSGGSLTDCRAGLHERTDDGGCCATCKWLRSRADWWIRKEAAQRSGLGYKRLRAIHGQSLRANLEFVPWDLAVHRLSTAPDLGLYDLVALSAAKSIIGRLAFEAAVVKMQSVPALAGVV